MSDVPVEPAATPSSRSGKWTLRLIAWSICAAILVLVIRALVGQFAKVDWSQVRFRPAQTATAVACVFAVSLMQLVARWALLFAYGYPLGWRAQIPASWVPPLGKYVPGGIVSVGSGVYLLRNQGVPAAVGLSVTVLIDALAVMAGLIVSTPLLLWQPVRHAIPLGWLACAAMTIVGLILLHPRVFVALLNWSLRAIKRQPIAQVPPLSKYVLPVLASFGQWIFAGFGLWFMTAAVVHDLAPAWIPYFIATAALAMTVSYLTPFTPGGVGIREGIYLIVLSPMLPPGERPAIAIVVVAMRIIQTLMEVLLAVFGALLLRRNREPST